MSENIVLDVSATVTLRGVPAGAGERELLDRLRDQLRDGRDVTDLDFEVRRRVAL